MPEELVTAGVFGDQTQAVAARLLLEAAGIPAFLHDELVAGGIFLWSPAVGGIKLQVPQSRLDEAFELLNERLPNEEGATDWSKVDVGVPEEDDETPADEEPPEPNEAPPAVVSKVEEQAFAEPNLREKQADVISRGWVFGLLFFPVMFFLWWQLIWVALAPDRLSDEYRRKLRIAAIGIVATTLFWLTFAFVVYLIVTS